jgi:ArsR family transcriptional regulator
MPRTATRTRPAAARTRSVPARNRPSGEARRPAPGVTRTPAQYAARARVAKALAHPSRLLILDLLADGERCVCDITPRVGADQSTVSKHLAVLKQAGIIDDRRDGPRTYYRTRLHCLRGLWDCIDNVLQENLRAQQAALGCR